MINPVKLIATTYLMTYGQTHGKLLPHTPFRSQSHHLNSHPSLTGISDINPLIECADATHKTVQTPLTLLHKCFSFPKKNAIKQSIMLGTVSAVAENAMLKSLNIVTTNSPTQKILTLCICAFSRSIYIGFATQILTESSKHIQSLPVIKHTKKKPLLHKSITTTATALLAASIIFAPWMLILEKQNQ